ncbi:hypothetical protein OG944_36835 [Streptomyces anulatus]|uniref:hypothetical protein n=1 Tax=Streptomyces anulatus TaxID=1892 RepID=UPI002E80CE5F|nr:hypothetical protein [Streptomyces anulatus]WTC67852.1 hypothetical protein OG865_37205 [Streptomyces anulatus]WTC69039.1 hypothetical protein OG882_01340 [Streptomyces anulatus]WUC91218.1 hypothetical protein OHQ35_36125 [Streptomyces anulatus]WUD93506.1 hypothetical protein OG703_37330 [Streptomyces anulatus]
MAATIRPGSGGGPGTVVRGGPELDEAGDLGGVAVPEAEGAGDVEDGAVGFEELDLRGDLFQQGAQVLKAGGGGEFEPQVDDVPLLLGGGGGHPALPGERWPRRRRSAERVPAGWRSA